MDGAQAIRVVREHLERQFPRSCGNCGREYATLRDYLRLTRHVGDPVSNDLEAGAEGEATEAGAVMSLALCACGTTMALDSEGMGLRTRLALARYARAETRRRAVSFRRILRDLRATIDAQVLAEPAAEADASAPVRDHGAVLYLRTIARVTDHLRTTVLIGLAIATVILGWRIVHGGHVWPAAVVWVAMASFSGALWGLRDRPRVATGVAVVFLELVLVVALVAFGPLGGTGVVVAVAVLLTSIQFGRTASLVVTVQAAALIVVIGATVGRHAGGDAPQLPLTAWLRTGVTTGAIAAFIAMATSSLLNSLRNALAELERARQLNERAQADLARRRELETAGRLVSGVVHDINNSLTVVVCCVEELRAEARTPAARDLLADIETTTRAASGTMRAMLDFVRPTRDEAAVCDPARVIAEVARNLQRLLPDDVTLQTSLVEGHMVPLSRGALLQATVNLVLNARDALEGERREIAVTVEPADGAVVVAVRDTGKGMDAATVARVGEPFFSTKGAAGTGLGLSMVRATVEACGGKMVIESAPGRGTEVRMVLPVATPAAEAAAPTLGGAVTGKRVLLVEDDDAIRRAFARGLTSAGALVVEAPSVARAVAELTPSAPTFDALISDGILGDGTVADVLGPFRRRCPGAPVLLCTAHSADVFIARGLVLGDAILIAKPITGVQLVRALAQALQASAAAPVTASVAAGA